MSDLHELIELIRTHSDRIGTELAEHCDDIVRKDEVQELRDENQRVKQENATLREEITALRSRVNELESEVEAHGDRVDGLEGTVDELEDSIEVLRRRYDAKNEMLADGISELQGRELETGAHLREENVDTDRVEVHDGHLEVITKDDGNQYCRLPGEEDVLERGGAVAHSTTDLLPLQRLSRYDDAMLASTANSQPDELAAKAWRQRDDARRHGLWSKGSGDVRVYLSSSDLTDWIMQERPEIRKKYAQELARRTMDAMLHLANGKLAKTKKERRTDGLRYKESRIVLFRDVDLPGEVGPASDAAPATSEGAGA